MTTCPHCGHEFAPTRVGLTEQQRQLVDYIKAYTAKNRGRSPSYDEMRRAMCLASKSGIHRMIVALEERGHVVRIGYRTRTVVAA